MWGNPLTQKTTYKKWSFYILFRSLPFCRFTHSLYKNENFAMRGQRIAP